MGLSVGELVSEFLVPSRGGCAQEKPEDVGERSERDAESEELVERIVERVLERLHREWRE